MYGFVARQPIYDGRGSLFAYELLFRPGSENAFSGDAKDHDIASQNVINNSLDGIGLETLTRGHRAFINVTRRVLLDGLFHALPPEQTVVELLETVEADDEVIAAVRKLKDEGYLLALDDFVLRPELEPLLPFVDFLKFDFLATTSRERRRWLQKLGSSAVRLIAEKVENRAHFEQALAEGFTYFQGYYFQRPEIFSTGVIPPFKLNALRILRDLNSARFEMDRIEAITRQEAALAERLLEDLNATPAGSRTPVKSVRQARELLGESAFRRWASLVALAALGDDRPPEFVATCLLRARFCELVAQKTGVAAEASMFLVGLLSACDSLIGRPLGEILEQLTLPSALESALLGRPGPEGDALLLVTSYERGDWDEVLLRSDRLGLGEDKIPTLYRQTVEWTNRMWKT
jgi:EAL and modified HD-GYP domain-containing signal transduction protein